MLHLVPQREQEARPEPYAEAVSRLASVRHALRLVDGGFGDGPSDDLDGRIASVWENAGEARQRCFDRRSAQLVGATAAGIEVLLSLRNQGREPHRAASQALVDQVRSDLRKVAGIVLA